MLGLFEPSPNINYNFVCFSYAIATVVCIALAISSLVFKVSSINGWYITLAPFPPCFLWSLIVRQRWLVSEAAEAEEKKTKKE